MDGNIRFHSRPTALRRLYFYIFPVVLVGVLLTPGQSTGVYDHKWVQSDPGVKIAVSRPVKPADTPAAPADTPAVSEPAPVKLQLSAVKVKTGYHAIIQQAGQRHGVEAAMIKAIIMAESSYDPRAVSNRGAAGLMQLMPTTADSMGVKDRFDPAHNINGGVRYFKKLLGRFEGDTRLALAAYNAGARKVRQHNGIPPYKTTHSYIAKVFQYYERYKDIENSTTNKV